MRNVVVNAAGEIEKAGCVVIDHFGKILLVKNLASGDPWGLPKGHVEADEGFLEAAKRETREETGLDVEAVLPLPDLVYKHGRTGQMIRVHLWLAKAGESVLQSEKDERCEWFEYEDAKRRVFPNVAAYLTEIKHLLVVD